MATSGSDYMEKPPSHLADATPISQGVRTHNDYDVERPKERKQSIVAKLKNAYDISDTGRRPSEDGSIKQYDQTHRKLKPRHIQLIGIGGTIGTVRRIIHNMALKLPTLRPTAGLICPNRKRTPQRRCGKSFSRIHSLVGSQLEILREKSARKRVVGEGEIFPFILH
jgi:hypothetical protein